MFDITLIQFIQATWETIYMVLFSSAISISFGLVLGCILFVTKQKTQFFYRMIGTGINIIRSLPFIILMIALIPLTRLIAGTSIGTNAAVIPLAIAAIPFYARISETAFAEVSPGLIEASHAMGASTWHIISKVVLPESLPTLIRGATLTVIALIGYSAMAGVIGGGGLGELAINYGYQRFDTVVMFETVLILILMVQGVQMVGDVLAKKRTIIKFLLFSFLFLIFSVLFQTFPATLQQQNTIRVGVMNGWPEQVMQVAATVAENKYGIKLKIITFSDYVQPNIALNNGSIDVNIFQHLPYLDAQIKSYHFSLAPIGKTFVYPMGFYSKKIHHLNQLNDHAIIAIPNDPSNGARALLILQKYGLIKLKPNVGVLATVNDIVENKYHLQVKLLDAATIPRSLKDVDLAAITNDYIGPAGFTMQQAIMREGSDSPYANIIVVRTQDEKSPIFEKLVAIMHSKAVYGETTKIFPHGAAIPAWAS